ncbi:MAG: kynureninase [Cytophagales bacterium]|nr:kynureninase [Bernardetiaceae bacterium]MDW8205993.1 kynureninase [Cytophagales bacterium]
MQHSFENTLAFAQSLDASDTLRSFRNEFILPAKADGTPKIYFCGNSLGLQPKTAADYVAKEMQRWATLAVEGHFQGEPSWFNYHRTMRDTTAKLVGALPHEVVIMNTLTVNLHLMMVSFYRPTAQRYKILMEAGAFPSDQYAVESQVRFHGLDPAKAIVEVAPREGEATLRIEDIEQAIDKHANSLALVLFGGVHYYTGQAFDLKRIAAAAHAAGAKVGFDLAHAVGNLPLHLHQWDADFAVWCTYKYLNSGPGGTSGAFIHERYANNTELPRFAGWWGYREESRFLMQKGFVPMYGAEGWQLSCGQIFPFAVHRASLEIFERAGIEYLRAKSIRLTSFLAFLLEQINQQAATQLLHIITPSDPHQRGCQLSLVVPQNGKKVFEQLIQAGVVCDWREPDVIRVAPVPLYNTFEEVWQFAAILTKILTATTEAVQITC